MDLLEASVQDLADKYKLSVEERAEEQLTIKVVNDHHRIKFNKTKDCYTMSGDFYYFKFNEKDLSQDITQRYTYNKTLRELKKKGFFLQNEKTETDGSIHITFGKF